MSNVKKYWISRISCDAQALSICLKAPGGDLERQVVELDEKNDARSARLASIAHQGDGLSLDLAGMSSAAAALAAGIFRRQLPGAAMMSSLWREISGALCENLQPETKTAACEALMSRPSDGPSALFKKAM